MKWDQEKITKWAEKQFGFNGPLPIAIRGNKEMAELLSHLQNQHTVGEVKAAAMECADVLIFLFQVCHRLGFNLLELVDEKMDINENRTWGRAADGSFQHVEPDEILINGHVVSGDSGFCRNCTSSEFTKPCPGF